MVQIVLIEKNGTVKQSNAKDLTKETIYKKCGLKNDSGFKKRTTWNTTIGSEKCLLELWSKDDGKAGTENKFELPEPIDKNLYFGTMAVVRVNSNGAIIDIKTDLWNKAYDKLMGDFDDLDEEEEEDEEDDEDELASVAKSMKTKSGYLKDGFVVETNSEDEEYVEEDDGEDEDEDEDDEEDEEDEDSDELELEEDDSEGSELDEESYEYSDEDEDEDEEVKK